MSPIVAEVYGPDYAGPDRRGKAGARGLRRHADIIGVDDTVDEDAEKLVLRVNQAKAALLGVAQKDIVEVVRMGLSGEDVTPVHDGDAKYEIPVRIVLPAERQNSIDQLLKLKLRSAGRPAGAGLRSGRGQAPAAREGHLPQGPAAGGLRHRRHGRQARFAALRHVRHPFKSWSISSCRRAARWASTSSSSPGTPTPSIRHQVGRRMAGDLRDLPRHGCAYAVGLILIYLLVVAQFKSYLVPLIIMAPIPLTIIGVMPGHALFGAQYTATSMIGMIALAGIIVRNSILLVDFINEQVAGGMDFAEAVIQAAAVRAKPIVLTGLAAMLGALFIVDDPIFAGLALSLIFGIFVSTLLTLVVIPVLYYAVMQGRIVKFQ
jgi:multidrug efflux pump subunit AcrB